MDLSLRQLEQAVSLRRQIDALERRSRKPEAAVGNEDGELCPRPRELKSQRLHAPVGLESEVDVRPEAGAKSHVGAVACLPRPGRNLAI
jgi:hypothetical protein